MHKEPKKIRQNEILYLKSGKSWFYLFEGCYIYYPVQIEYRVEYFQTNQNTTLLVISRHISRYLKYQNPITYC